MHTYWHPAEMLYDGRQLRSLFAYRSFRLPGDSIVGFAGPCRVSGHDLVDQEDALAGDHIISEWMLHFLVEHFGCGLEMAVWRQRLLVNIAREAVAEHSGVWARRQGDDLYVGERKLSVSIATVSPVSALIHLGLNVRPGETPVPAVGLAELGVADEAGLGEAVMRAYAREVEDVQMACCKVRAVE